MEIIQRVMTRSFFCDSWNKKSLDYDYPLLDYYYYQDANKSDEVRVLDNYLILPEEMNCFIIWAQQVLDENYEKCNKKISGKEGGCGCCMQSQIWENPSNFFSNIVKEY